MSTASTIHTLVPGANIPYGYFDEDNIRFVQNKILKVLKRKFVQDIKFDRGSVIRLMERALLDRIETIPRMNQRAVMYGVNEFMVHQLDVDKHLKWEAHFVESQRFYDPTTEVSRFDAQNKAIQQTDYRGLRPVGATQRFYFT